MVGFRWHMEIKHDGILLGYYVDMIEIQEVDLRANLGTWVGIPKLIGISCKCSHHPILGYAA